MRAHVCVYVWCACKEKLCTSFIFEISRCIACVRAFYTDSSALLVQLCMCIVHSNINTRVCVSANVCYTYILLHVFIRLY